MHHVENKSRPLLQEVNKSKMLEFLNIKVVSSQKRHVDNMSEIKGTSLTN